MESPFAVGIGWVMPRGAEAPFPPCREWTAEARKIKLASAQPVSQAARPDARTCRLIFW